MKTKLLIPSYLLLVSSLVTGFGFNEYKTAFYISSTATLIAFISLFIKKSQEHSADEKVS